MEHWTTAHILILFVEDKNQMYMGILSCCVDPVSCEFNTRSSLIHVEMTNTEL